jgi:nucleoside-diphosphate-sugar epimerase
MCSSDSEIKFLSLPVDDPKKRKPDITKAKEILKWNPKVNLKNGLKRTIEFFQKNTTFGRNPG